MSSYSYETVLAYVLYEVSIQLSKAEVGSSEVLHVPCIIGPVGAGKTSLAREVATILGLEMVKINCGETGDTTEVSGMPNILVQQKVDGEGSYTEWILNVDMFTACMRPVVLLFDDIDKAPSLVQGALLSIFGERKVRGKSLHPGTVLLAAGNREQDDGLARGLSESLRTRLTSIVLEPTMQGFAKMAKEAEALGKPIVHPVILGFLTYKPTYLHRHDPDAMRFPTPRTWVEASASLFERGETDKFSGSSMHPWELLIELKCGEAVAKDFKAWFDIVRKVDVVEILRTGKVDKTDEMMQYATVFAVTQVLNNRGVDKKDGGLVPYLKGLSSEMRVAFLVQVKATARDQIAKWFPEAASLMLENLVQVSGP